MKYLTATLLAFGVVSMPASAGWVLDADDSAISFTSTKANTAAEVHGFGRVSGGVDDDGVATLTIELDSVDTSIEIRDQRMRELLFETAEYPAAKVKVELDADAVEAIEPGDSKTMSATAELSLHGSVTELPVQMKIARLAENRLLVASERPVIVNASQVGLLDGVEKLREIAGLPSISPAVPVTFVLAFDAD